MANSCAFVAKCGTLKKFCLVIALQTIRDFEDMSQHVTPLLAFVVGFFFLLNICSIIRGHFQY